MKLITRTEFSTGSVVMPASVIMFWIFSQDFSEIFVSACCPREKASCWSDTVQYTTRAPHNVSFKMAFSVSSCPDPGWDGTMNFISGNTPGNRFTKPGSRMPDLMTSLLKLRPASAYWSMSFWSVTNCHGLMWTEPWLSDLFPLVLQISNLVKAKVSASAVLTKSSISSTKIETTGLSESLYSAADASYTFNNTFKANVRPILLFCFAASINCGDLYSKNPGFSVMPSALTKSMSLFCIAGSSCSKASDMALPLSLSKARAKHANLTRARASGL
mmetsp:Transcript_92805/g.267969  ORF Transcript_92805/g.267969 Transcript_92805/m.267969 type:complete len:274 (-) Transcript_92805:4258-5079(-)